MQTLLLTNSYDATADLLISYIGSDHVFRLNFDQWDSYKLCMLDGSVNIETEFHSLNSSQVVKSYWRKPFAIPAESDQECKQYVNSELHYIFRELHNLFSATGRAVLVSPHSERFVGKLSQLRIAKRYFLIPKWSVFWNSLPDIQGQVVVKSLSSERVGMSRIFFTKQVALNTLSPTYPWYAQELVQATHDITVVYVGGYCYAFSLDRSLFESMDWRRAHEAHGAWQHFDLAPALTRQIQSFMNDCRLSFGRLDFLKCADKFFFLEVNPNGEWGWLDTENKYGLLARMIEEVSPLCALHTPPLI